MHHTDNNIRFNLRALTSHLFDFWFCVYLLCWISVFVLRALEIHIHFVNDWLTDLIFVPVTVHIALVLARIVYPRQVQPSFPLYQILFVSFLAALVFELFAPNYSSRYTADAFDVVCYFAGGFFYYYVHQPLALKRDFN